MIYCLNKALNHRRRTGSAMTVRPSTLSMSSLSVRLFWSLVILDLEPRPNRSVTSLFPKPE